MFHLSSPHFPFVLIFVSEHSACQLNSDRARSCQTRRMRRKGNAASDSQLTLYRCDLISLMPETSCCLTARPECRSHQYILATGLDAVPQDHRHKPILRNHFSRFGARFHTGITLANYRKHVCHTRETRTRLGQGRQSTLQRREIDESSTTIGRR